MKEPKCSICGGKHYQTFCPRKRKPIKKKPIKKLNQVKKPINKWGFDNQKDLFSYIWDKREHVCFVSGQPLDEFYGTDEWYWCFEHCLGKGAYPSFKLNPDNIVLLHPDIHFMITNNSIELQDKSGYDFTEYRILKNKLKRYYEEANR